MVGYEDGGLVMNEFQPVIANFKKMLQEENLNIDFVWHAGETVDIDGKGDQNLFDALAIGTKRIGHG